MKLFHVKHSADGQKSACQPFWYNALRQSGRCDGQGNGTIKINENANISEILMKCRQIKRFTNKIIILSLLYRERQ